MTTPPLFKENRSNAVWNGRFLRIKAEDLILDLEMVVMMMKEFGSKLLNDTRGKQYDTLGEKEDNDSSCRSEDDGRAVE